MGNMIPHGHRLHECGPRCPEYKPTHRKGTMADAVRKITESMQPRPVMPSSQIFGMPGVGHGVIPPGALDRDLVTHPPDNTDYSWGIEFQHPQQRAWTQLIPGVGTAMARRIVDKHLPKALEHFLQRNAEYGDDDDFNLGTKGQYVDISRKVQKLKRRWWEDEEYGAGEESDEVIVMELIGHLLMALDMMAGGENGEKQDTR